MKEKVIYAETINYWKTGQSDPDTWMGKTKRQITALGGTVLAEGFVGEPQTGHSAYMLGFEIGGNRYKVIWPVLPSKSKNTRAARIQAATMLYHDIKARCVSSAVLGARAAFFSFLMLPDGRTAAEVATPELLEVIPSLFTKTPQLRDGR